MTLENNVYVYDSEFNLISNASISQEYNTIFSSATTSDNHIYIGTNDFGMKTTPGRSNLFSFWDNSIPSIHGAPIHLKGLEVPLPSLILVPSIRHMPGYIIAVSRSGMLGDGGVQIKFVSSNQYYGNKMKASVVRYGNVMNSRGSVLPIFISCANKNIPFPITDEKMTRFNITLEESVKLVIWTIQNSFGSEIIVPKISSYKILDVATGTGDVVFAFLKKHDVEIIGLDYAFNMIEIAKAKAEKFGLSDKTLFVQGDGEALPFTDNSFDRLTISFGFRNIGHYDLALKEFKRVLKPGGQLLILEFSEPKSNIFNKIYQFYFKRILPRLGALLSRADAYRYLPESVEYFPPRNEVCHLMVDCGFEKAEVYDLTFGVCSIFVGYN